MKSSKMHEVDIVKHRCTLYSVLYTVLHPRGEGAREPGGGGGEG